MESSEFADSDNMDLSDFLCFVKTPQDVLRSGIIAQSFPFVIKRENMWLRVSYGNACLTGNVDTARIMETCDCGRDTNNGQNVVKRPKGRREYDGNHIETVGPPWVSDCRYLTFTEEQIASTEVTSTRSRRRRGEEEETDSAPVSVLEPEPESQPQVNNNEEEEESRRREEEEEAERQRQAAEETRRRQQEEEDRRGREDEERIQREEGEQRKRKKIAEKKPFVSGEIESRSSLEVMLMLAVNSRVDGHPSYIENSETMEIRHWKRTTNNAKNVAMMESDICRIVLIGKTGAGKSTLGNTLSGEKRFSDFGNFQLLSDRAESKIVLAENSLFRRKTCLVDTPGLFDTRFLPEQIKNEIWRCTFLTTPGPHAIILTIKASRFTKEDIEVFKTYIDMFGESMLKYTVVVFTHFDHWKQIEGKTRDEAIEDFIKSFPDTVNQFLKRIKNRYVMVDTKGKDVEDETKALIFAIEQMITDNKNDFYSYQHFIDSRKSQLKAESLFADENRRQKKKKNRRKLTSSFRQKTMKRTRFSFERETGASMVPDSKRRYNCRA